MSARKVDLAWGGTSSTCTVEGCLEQAGGWVFGHGKCAFHGALATARNLSPEEFDRLRASLATTPPLTEEERRARRVRGALSTIEWNARDLKRSKKRAEDAGATASQIADAVRSGKAKS